jgi:hypothetical protein
MIEQLLSSASFARTRTRTKKKQFTLAGELGEAIILSWKNKSTTRRLETPQVGVFLVNKM